MSGSLLKHSSEWFMRPPHLKKQPNHTSHQTPNIPSPPTRALDPIVPPDEEFYIRKCCPVTLRHLLPDLCLTQKHHMEESTVDFDVNMVNKFEKHLEDSHRPVSCSASTINEEDEEEQELEEDNLEGRIENDINLHILQNIETNTKSEFRNKHLLRPHKVNYPDSNMKELTLPGITLNNKFSMPSSEEIFSTTFPRAKNARRATSEIDYRRPDSNNNNIMFPNKNNKLQPLHGDKDISYSQSRRYKKSVLDPSADKQFNPFDRPNKTIIPRIDIDPSLADSRSREDVSNQLTSHLRLHPQYSSLQSSKPSLCVHHHHRSRSLSPFKISPLKSGSHVFPASPDNLILPSPHLIQLARLKKEELELQEKMLLRQRQRLEVERLRPPDRNWYEMKNQKFHQEAHRNTVFLRNENDLPIIRERRRQIVDALMTTDS